MKTNEQNGTTRRSLFAGLMTLPAAAAVAHAAVTAAPSSTRAAATQTTAWMPDILRQSDLQSVFDDLNVIELRILEYRRRVLAGAVIEPGPLVCEFEVGGPRQEEPEPGRWTEFGAADFNICPVQDSLATIIKELRAKELHASSLAS